MSPEEIKLHAVVLVALDAAARAVRDILYTEDVDRTILLATLEELKKPEHIVALQLIEVAAIKAAMAEFLKTDDATNEPSPVADPLPDGWPPGWRAQMKFTLNGRRWIPRKGPHPSRMSYENEEGARRHAWEQHRREVAKGEHG